jgi:hypothetical protein
MSLHRKIRRLSTLLGAVAAAVALTAPSNAANVSIIMPLHRTAYQTNEWIDVSVVRSDAAALPAGNLTLTVSGEDASKMVFTFPVKGVAVEGTDARATEHLHLNGRLIRPGKYVVEAAADGATAATNIEVYTHLRRTDFKLIDWGSTTSGKEQTVIGQDSLGFNLIYYGRLSPDDMIRGGADFMRNCTMGGGHQMDLRMECDWSDPYALQGGEARVVNEAMQSRIYPNCIGVHFYDEPGLSWWKDPKNDNVMVPFNLPPQDRAYKSAFGMDAPHWSDVKPDDAAAVKRWNQMNRWKESFLEAAWKISAFGVSEVRSDLLSVNQSQYGWMAYADGYYFNVVRSLPVISGHGGYDDMPGAYFAPGFFHEMGRVRDVNKPVWYMPMWYKESSDQCRLQQYLSFMTDLQGMAKPPGMQVQHPDKSSEAIGIVESNKLMARLGTIFTTMRPTRPEVAVLYSLSQDLGAEVRDMQDHKKVNVAAYEGGDHVRAKMLAAYLAGKVIHTPLWPVVEEDVLDGSLAANHKAVLLAGVNFLDAKVVTALEAYITGGGVVLVSDDCQVQIKGAQKLGIETPTKLYHDIGALWATDQKKSQQLRRVEYWLKEVEPFAKALEAKLSAIGVKPALDADSPAIITQRQAQGDIEYLFAVNATPKPDDEIVHIQSATATLSMAANGWAVYDAVHGVVEEGFKPQGDHLSGRFHFGPGAMRVFARTARPIGGVQVQTPVLFRDFTVADAPVRIEAAATLVDDRHTVLSGSAPLQIRLIDPLGEIRYDLYRATDRGSLRIDLPLAANDPAGQWKLEVRELLSGKEGAASFTYRPGTQCAAVAGATHRAVYFGDDREHIFKLFRTHQDFTVIVGSGNYDAAAERVAEILKPWGAQCKMMKAADVKTRPITPDEARTWSGLGFGRVDPNKTNPAQVGFDVRGPAILIGTPADNALIKFADDHGFLPYRPEAERSPKKPVKKAAGESADFPGRGRGYIAWQRDAVSYGAESITLIGTDPAGISEAVGSLYEAAAGLDPLTQYALPAPAAVMPASARTSAPEAAIAWRTIVPDRVAMLRIDGNQIIATTADGSATTLDAAGKVIATGPGEVLERAVAPKLPAELEKQAMPGRIVKRIATGNGMTAIGYWGGTVQVVDGSGATKSVQMLANDVSDMGWLNGKLIVGLADGTVVALEVK